jgi:PKD repeat protein
MVPGSNPGRPIIFSLLFEFSGKFPSKKRFHYPKSLNISCYFEISTILKRGMMLKKGFFIGLIIISIIATGCDVYNTLYVRQGNGEEIPDSSIMVEDSGDFSDMGETNAVEPAEIPEDASIIIIDETGKISLVANAEDPDNDNLIFTFTSPLDENGQWQTSYGDAGQYTITVTVSDGELTSSKEVLIIVNKKEEAPVFDSFNPGETAVVMDETDTLDFEVQASDLNDDALTISWKLDGVDISKGDFYSYRTTYEDSGSHTVKAIVSDGAFDTERIWAVTVKNVNREPVLQEVDDMTVDETETVVIVLNAVDPDGDELQYEIDDSRFVQDGNSFSWETTYDDEGEHLVTVSVSDLVDTTSQQVAINVKNVNRAPVIVDIVQQ